ncbi:putative fasciclin-like arabinogalactan protein 20 [Argentina anserina]|uniref:putative fasciclin-like arabinogalactan protein 20 n=1 Tax=Argentina anserina TaxID=57926 RepID=UPI002176817C|nr:putative fasciclin-like arabinogalactan protein 20 [Potentilla anserina]
MKSSPTTLLLLILFSLTSASSAVASPATLLTAAPTLSNSGFLSMALTLQIAAGAGLDLASPTATIFAPPDTAFFQSGPPSLPLLQYHISPRRLSVNTLPYLRRGAKIQTLLPNYTLTVTASPPSEGFSSINDVRVDPNSVLDDGSVIIYAVDQFFNLTFLDATTEAPAPSPISAISGQPHRVFGSVADLLRSRGYSVMAAFLDAQLIGFNRKTALTLFAPADDAVEDYARNTSDYSAIFRSHVVPKLLTWRDLVALDDGTMLPTFAEGFTIDVIKMGDVPVLNDVPVAEQDLYQSRFVVVHGINRLLTSQKEAVAQAEGPAGDEEDVNDGFVANVAEEINPQGFDDYH